MDNHSLLISIDALLEEKMLAINGHQVLPDYDLSELLQISIYHLRKKVKDNKKRFPADFLFTISNMNFSLSPCAKKSIYAFSWGGIMQAVGLFKTKRAIEIHLQLIRCYTKMLKEKSLMFF
ncbi:MAG TPA: ORF6N domain-containing protein [Chitinophagaceae bacterium]|nr:ORF6N domain-containing protein [Chitinophagaceae bacterium]